MRVLAVNNKDDNIRRMSSSGGVFYELARFVIKHDGLVIGVTYGESAYDVLYTVVDSMDELHKLQKSKYAPAKMNVSVIGDALLQADKRWVLFSGTPCHVMAVKKKYGKLSKLIFVEIACHGVPTRESYSQFIQENDIVQVDFRCKRNGWKDSEIEMRHFDGSVSYVKSVDLPFYQNYIKGNNLRKACFACPAKQFKSGADFTLGDFWGVDAFLPELYDNKGTSVVFLHTNKACRIWRMIESQFLTKRISFFEAVRHNPCIYRAVGSEVTGKERLEEKKFIIKSYLKSAFRKLSLSR